MKIRLFFFLFFISSFFLKAQNNNPFTSNFYFAWGYNAEWYSHSTISVSQPAFGNNYQLRDISGADRIGWDKLFFHALTVPQYNYRLGFFFKKHPSWGFEINFDHTKYQLIAGQDAHIVGSIHNQHVDTNMIIQNGYFVWKLNNGANFFCFNITKRFFIGATKNRKFRLYNIFKAGAGPTVPHVENILLGEANTPHFQLGGWNVGLEANYRLEIGRFFYMDLAQKVDYARYFGLQVYYGLAKQSFYTYEVMGTLGIMLPYKQFLKKENTTTSPTTVTPASN